MKAESYEDADFVVHTNTPTLQNQVVKDARGLGWTIPVIAAAWLDPNNPTKVLVMSAPQHSRSTFDEFAEELRTRVEIACAKHPYVSLEWRALACAGEAGELAQVVTKSQGIGRFQEESMDVAVTAYRAWARR